MRAFLPARWDMFGCFWNALFPNHIHITSEESGTVADTARSALDIYIYIYTCTGKGPESTTLRQSAF